MEEEKPARYTRAEGVLKALANKSRLEILDMIEKGFSNPGEMSRKMRRARSTIEKHLRILGAARIIQKVPSLTSGGQLTIRYKVRDDAKQLVATIRDLSQRVWQESHS